MALYETLEEEKGKAAADIKFANLVQHPQFPLIKPLCGTRDFKLSDIYTIVVAHIKKAIVDWFVLNGKVLDMDKTIWVETVPAIANHKHKEFMKRIFVDGMG
jgi:hypothetical protein